MSEVLGQDVQTVLPYALTVVGAGFGVALEAYIHPTLARNDKALTEIWGEIERPSSLMRRWAGGLMIAGAGFGLANGLAWQTEPVEQPVLPQLEIVVDHSGATALGDGLAAKEISQIVNLFSDKNKVEADALIASSGEVRNLKVSGVAENIPFGDAPLEQATTMASDTAKRKKVNTSGGSTVKNAGVLIITNGNGVGSALSVIPKAKETDTPVFVANVEASGSNPAITDELKAIADQTKATYWDVNEGNINQVADKIEKTLVADKINHKRGSKLPIRIFTGALTVLGMSGIYINRRKTPFGNGVKGK